MDRKVAIEVTICRNIEVDEDSPEFECEVERLLYSLGREWTVVNYEFMDYDGFLPA